MTNSRPACRAIGLALTVMIVAAAGSCPSGYEEIVFDQILTELQDHIEDELGFTVHVLLPPLSQGTVIVPDTPGGHPAAGKRLECDGRKGCVLAMLDLMPRAHFAHPVVLALYELEDHELETMEADWWPYDPDADKRYFSTVAERRATLVCQSGQNCFQFYPPPDPTWRVDLIGGTRPPPTPLPAPTRSVWAVVVNGYDDPDDTFDEDTEGMYRVLLGMGVSQDHICYLTDDGQAPGHDDIARRTTVKAALDYVAMQTNASTSTSFPASVKTEGEQACGSSDLDPTDGCTDFLFFLSSHGTLADDPAVGEVLCNHYKVPPSEGSIKSDELVKWLAPINAQRTTVVIEACHSGGFKSDLETLKTTHGHDNVAIFLSSRKDGVSFGDLDPPDYDDENPGDAGSETTWGFVEAFGTSEADTDPAGTPGHREVSFSEAAAYAETYDITPPSEHDSVVWKDESSPPSGPYLGTGSLYGTSLAITSGPTTTAAGSAAALKRCSFNDIGLEVENTGANNLGVATVRLHMEEATDTTVFDWDHAPTLILPGLVAGDSAKLAITFEVDDGKNAGEVVTIRASVDSPQAPVAGHPAQTSSASPTIVNPSCTLLACGCRTLGGP